VAASLETSVLGTANGAPAARPDEVAEIEADLARARERVAASVRALGDEVARRGDWRGWVRERPAIAVGGALLLGFLWGRGRRVAITTDNRRS